MFSFISYYSIKMKELRIIRIVNTNDQIRSYFRQQLLKWEKNPFKFNWNNIVFALSLVWINL